MVIGESEEKDTYSRNLVGLDVVVVHEWINGLTVFTNPSFNLRAWKAPTPLLPFVFLLGEYTKCRPLTYRSTSSESNISVQDPLCLSIRLLWNKR